MDKIEFVAGKRYNYQRNPIKLVQNVGMYQVLGTYEATGALVTIPVNQLEVISAEETLPELPTDNILHISDKAWAKARNKLSIIEPLINGQVSRELFEQVASKNKVSIPTLYRWIRSYRENNSVNSLLDIPNNGGAGKIRVDSEIDSIIQEAIQSVYLTTQKRKVAKVILAVQEKCSIAGKPAPGDSTIRRRINRISEEEKMRRRWSKKMAKEKFDPLGGEFPGADYPLAVVQIDHTQVDIMLVDEKYRQPLSRPYLTLATDVFSRMTVGMYISFDPVGSGSVGMCMAHALLTKETWLSRINVEGNWPSWGVPTVLYLDNAKEFRGKTLRRACEKYGIRQEFRPVAVPHWGGHIERLVRTFMEETHDVPGTTFSNVQERKDYFSEKKAALTLPEFERWFTTFVVNVYHKRIHSSLHVSPLQRYEQGIIGTSSQLGTGLPAMLLNELQVRLDFMPDEERTIQQYGVVIDHVCYYADVLRPYINLLEEGSGKNRRKRKFFFKRDPRDISRLYFLDPVTKQYNPIPYRNTEYPPISIWEFRQALAIVKKRGKEFVNSDEIFRAYASMEKIVLDAVKRTRQVNKTSNRMLKGSPTEISSLLPPPSTDYLTVQISAAEEYPDTQAISSYSDGGAQSEEFIIMPYDDIYDSASE